MDAVTFRHLDILTDRSKVDIPKGCKRPAKPCSLGQEIVVRLNTFHVNQFPQKPVHQYDITINYKKPTSDGPKRGVLVKVWNSKTVQNRVGKGWLWDGNKAAWYVILAFFVPVDIYLPS
jgi:eukaryotic translation initiation factor 2C